MMLTWKDGVTTLLALLVAGLLYVQTTAAIQLPIIGSSYRLSIVALAIIGIAMCAFSNGGTMGANPFVTIASILGVVSLVLIIYGLITGTKIAFLALTGVILVLWVVATVNHLIGTK